MNIRLIAALAVPLVVLVGSAWRAETSLATGDDYLLQVRGVDPRDLLRGHFLRLHIEIPDDPEELGCLCLVGAAPEPAMATPIHCATARPRCDVIVETSELEGLTRYYIAEDLGIPAQRVLAEVAGDEAALARVHIDQAGNALLQSIEVEGRSIDTIAEERAGP